MKKSIYFFFIAYFLFSCTPPKAEVPSLPYFGVKQLDQNGDTLHHTVAPFSFMNQDSVFVTEKYLENKLTIVDFFFTTCPTICPIMTVNMQEIQEYWKENDTVQFLSHTVDPETDTPNKLKRYATYKKANLNNWHFVTGTKEALYTQGIKSYLVSAQEDALAPGGFLHSSLFALIDKNKHLRGVYDGTSESEMTKLNQDIKLLLDEK